MSLLLYSGSKAEAVCYLGHFDADAKNGCFTVLAKVGQSSWELNSVF